MNPAVYLRAYSPTISALIRAQTTSIWTSFKSSTALQVKIIKKKRFPYTHVLSRYSEVISLASWLITAPSGSMATQKKQFVLYFRNGSKLLWSCFFSSRLSIHRLTLMFLYLLFFFVLIVRIYKDFSIILKSYFFVGLYFYLLFLCYSVSKKGYYANQFYFYLF